MTSLYDEQTLTNFVNYRWASSQGIVEIGLMEIQYGCCQKSSRAYLCHVYWEYKYYPSQIKLVGRRPAPFLRLFATKSYEFSTQSTSKRYTSIRRLRGFHRFLMTQCLYSVVFFVCLLSFFVAKWHFFLYLDMAATFNHQDILCQICLSWRRLVMKFNEF